MRRHILGCILALAAVATSAAQAQEVEHKAATPTFASAASALRPLFTAAGPPNFQLSIEAELDNGGTIRVSRRLVKNVAAGTVGMPFSERKLSLSASDHEVCKLEGAAVAFFGGLQLSTLSGAAECRGMSSEVEGRLIAVTAIRGELFPLQQGNELSFAVRAHGELLDLFPTPVHHLKVAGMLSGVTLNATSAPDVIYLFRADEGPNGAKAPLVLDIYWSAALRWPIQARMWTDDGKLTLVERNLLSVAGVMPYALPDGREVSNLGERTGRSHSLAELDAIAQTLWRAAKSDPTHDVHRTAQVMAKLIDPRAQPSPGVDPAFESIAPFVTTASSTE